MAEKNGTSQGYEGTHRDTLGPHCPAPREPRLSLLPFQSGDSELPRKNWGLWFIIAFCQLCVHLPSPYLMFSFPAGEGLLLLTDKISLESFTVKSFMKCHCIHVSTRQGASQKGVAGTLLYIDCRQRQTVLGKACECVGSRSLAEQTLSLELCKSIWT